MKEDRQFVTALERGLRILRCFDVRHTKLGTTQLAQMTGLPQPTVWRLCYTLLKLGYLTQGDDDKLSVGPAALLLGFSALSEHGQIALLRPYMVQLAERYRCATALAERIEHHMVYVHRVRGDNVLQLNLTVGSRIAIHNSAIGWAYLAGLAPADREAMIAELDASDAKWSEVKDEAMRQIELFPSRGYVENRGFLNRDVAAVAVPLWSAVDDKVYAMNVGGLRTDLTEQVVAERLGPDLAEIGARFARQGIIAT